MLLRGLTGKLKLRIHGMHYLALSIVVPKPLIHVKTLKPTKFRKNWDSVIKPRKFRCPHQEVCDWIVQRDEIEISRWVSIPVYLKHQGPDVRELADQLVPGEGYILVVRAPPFIIDPEYTGVFSESGLHGESRTKSVRLVATSEHHDRVQIAAATW